MSFRLTSEKNICFLERYRNGGMLKTMSVLRLCERYIQRFENHPGNIEELYLQMLQEEQA